MKYQTILQFLLCIIIILVVSWFSFYMIQEGFANRNPINRISGVVYINLEDRKDRKKEIVTEMKKMRISPHKIHRVAAIATPKNGYKGCTQSHILGLTIGKLNKWKTTLLLEDDAELTVSSKEFQKRIAEMLDYLQDKRWDVIILSYANEQLQPVPYSQRIKRVTYSTTATAYIVNKHYLDTIIQLFKQGNSKMKYNIINADGSHKGEPNVTDQIWHSLQQKDKWYSFETNLINQRSSPSSSLATFSNEEIETNSKKALETFSTSRSSQKLKLAIHTVFLLQENLPFLEEWIQYHKNIGIDKFYLYDNSGSQSGNGLGSNSKINRYQIKFSKLISLSKIQRQKEMKQILKRHPEITYIRWQPRDEQNKIHYGYYKSLLHYSTHYGKKNDWTFYIDMDEFLSGDVINKNKLSAYIQSKQKQGITKLVLSQKKYEDRFCNLDKCIHQIDNYLDLKDTEQLGGLKCCIQHKYYDHEQTPESGGTMHQIAVSQGKTDYSPNHELRFNHYNVNREGMKYIQNVYKNSQLSFSKDTTSNNWNTTCQNSHMFNKTYDRKNRKNFCI